MRGPFTRLSSAVAASPVAQRRMLGAYFFLNEVGGYYLVMLLCALLVKRAGAAALPYVFLLLNLAFLPISLAGILAPPRSNTSAVRCSLGGYLLLLAVLAPLAASGDSPFALGALYAVARLGKLITTTFEPGMIAELLPLRAAKEATPALLASSTAGLIAGGLSLTPMLALLGNAGTFAALWATSAAALGALSLASAGVPEASGSAAPAGASAPGTIVRALSELMSDPLPRLLGLSAACIASLRYLLEYASSDALARRFVTEAELASFNGNFEAGLSIVTVLLQLVLVSHVVRWLRVQGTSLVLPAVLALALAVAAARGTFPSMMVSVFCYWLAHDCCDRPIRQAMIGALPPALLVRVPVLQAVMAAAGSVLASIALIALAGQGGGAAVLTALAVTALLGALMRGAGQAYSGALARTLLTLDGAVRPEALAWGDGPSPVESPEDKRARAIAQAVRAASAPPELREAARALFRMAHQPGDGGARAAAAQAMGELGYAVFAEELAALLADPDPQVRQAAAVALVRLRSPRGLAALRGALASEVDAATRECLTALVARLQDDTLAAVEQVLDGLDARDRGAIREVLDHCGTPARAQYLQQVLGIPAGRRRTALIGLGRSIRDEALFAILNRCLVRRDEQRSTDPSALLEHLARELPGSGAPGYLALRHVVDGRDWTALADHLEEVSRRVALGARPDGRGRALLEHALAVAAVAAPIPEQAFRRMQSSLSPDQRLSSVSLEALEDWLPDAIRRPVFALIEHAAAPALRPEGLI